MECTAKYVFVESDELPTANVLMDREEKPTGYTHIALEVPDLSAAREELDRLGIPLSGGPIDAGDAGFLFIRDPDLNTVEINQPQSPGGFRRSGH